MERTSIVAYDSWGRLLIHWCYWDVCVSVPDTFRQKQGKKTVSNIKRAVSFFPILLGAYFHIQRPSPTLVLVSTNEMVQALQQGDAYQMIFVEAFGTCMVSPDLHVAALLLTLVTNSFQETFCKRFSLYIACCVQQCRACTQHRASTSHGVITTRQCSSLLLVMGYESKCD